MGFQNLLDSLPIAAVFVVYTVFAAAVIEVGYRFGHWWQNRTPGETEGPTAMIVGSLLALMAFLLAITMGMATDRFDTRRGIVLEEANAIGTPYLRAGYLPEPASSEMRELWSIAEELARNWPESEVLALLIKSLNETIDLHETRLVAGVYARVPLTVFMLLLIGSLMTLGMMGYSAGLMRRRSPVTAFVMIVVLGAVMTLEVDLDRPRDGFLKVNQQPLIDLLEQIDVPTAAKDPV
jgi:hypothetical protein